MQSDTLIDILARRRTATGAGVTYIEGSNREEFLTYGELYDSALRALSFLQSAGMKAGDELILQASDNKTFTLVFWACILGGVIPVPLAVGVTDDHLQKVFNVWQVLRAPRLIVDGKNLARLGEYARQKGLGSLFSAMEAGWADESSLLSTWKEGVIHGAKADDIAFIQFSSGSTGSPKGVVLTHSNLITNIQAIGKAGAYAPEDSTLSWMPLTHDMGLIGFHLSPLFSGMSQFLMNTNLFIRRPALWLDKATEHAVSILCSPNFGFHYLMKHCPPVAKKYAWNLSAVRLIYNGAEPVSERLCRDFTDGLSIYGLRPVAMCPVYGLAEATLAASISRLDDEVISMAVGNNRVVNVGKVVEGCSIRIQNDGDEDVADGVTGHVQIKGANVTSCYYRNPEATRAALTADGWWRTGDIGFLSNGSLYITGRAKDIIFRSGQNYYPHDIERVAGEVEGIELNKIAVGGYFDGEAQKEMVVAFVLHRGDPESFLPTATALQALVNQRVGLWLDRVIPVKEIPRTTSGKLQRFALMEQFKQGCFDDVVRQLKLLMTDRDTDEKIPADEQKLFEIWRTVLKNKFIEPTRSFFEIGGNSLTAAEMSMMVLKEFAVELPIDRIYAKPTLKGLLEEIKGLQEQVYTPIPLTAPRETYPLSAPQKGLYYFWEVNPSSVAYNIPVALEIEGEVDSNRLEETIRRLIRRHDAWRLVFQSGSEPAFRVQDDVPFSLTITECPPHTLNEVLRQMVRPFHLLDGPLFRMQLLRTAPGRNILFADFHHSISDGVSIYHFVEELLNGYAGNGLEPMAVQYKDYTSWAKENDIAGKWQAQKEYWRRRLQEPLPLLEMPTVAQRPAVFDTQGKKMAFALDAGTAKRLRDFARQQHCTLHVLMLTIYQLLLSKYTGQEELVTGIPVAGRRHPDLRRMQGMFVNNLAIRSTITGDLPFVQLLRRLHGEVTAALANQDYPFDHLIHLSGGTRDMSRNPIFDTMFIYQNMGFPAASGTGLRLFPHFFDPGFSKFDISFEVFDDGEALSYNIEYSTRLFQREAMIRLAGHFENLIAGVMADPDAKVSALSMMTAAEEDACIRTFNSTHTEYPHTTIHQLIEVQVTKTPDQIAIVCGSQELSYRQLNKQADRLAGLLREKGVKAGIIVGILLRRSPELVISILAVLKAGGAYLPIEFDLPEERKKLLLRNSRSRLVITGGAREENAWLTQLPDLTAVTVDGSIDAAYGLAENRHPGQPEDLAYVIYTSGTTGIPKGVMIEHRSLVNYIVWAAQKYVRQEQLSFPLYTSISFDLTVTSIFTPLVTGNTIVVYDGDAGELLIDKIISENRVDIIKLTPSHLRLLRESRWKQPQPDTRIKRLIVGGEKLETRLAAEIFAAFEGRIEIYNEYGPTEATVGCMIHAFERDSTDPSVPIGIPAANTRIYLLDKCLRPVATGIDGELYIAGDGLARGYLFDEALTVQKFIPDPFQEGQKMYRTGDIARRLPGGNIEYIGRHDQQVKINGHRVELSEIEASLKERADIVEALAVVRTNGMKQPGVYAYYIPTDGQPGGAPITESDLRHHLVARLPYYMIPLCFTPLERIPLTSNGKVDVDRLPVPQRDLPAPTPKTPSSEMEVQLLHAWKKVLGKDDLSVTDNFYELGGDSIKAVQITSRLYNSGITLHARDILAYHTIEQICRYTAITHSRPAYEQGVAEGEKALSPIESWFFGQKLADAGFYNQSLLLVFHQKIEAHLVSASLKTLISHHDGLRMNYHPQKNLLFYNNRHLQQDPAVTEISVEACQAFKSGFNIEKDLLIKAAIIRENGMREMLFLTAHHLVTDGISWRVLLEDFRSVYEAIQKGDRIALPPKTATLIDWQKALTGYSETGISSGEEAWWAAVENIRFAIPVDGEIQDWTMQHVARVSGQLAVETTGFLLKDAHHVYGTDVPVILHTALAATLKKWTGLDKFVVEQEHHGRVLEGVDVSRTVGWFTSLYPMPLEWKNDTPGNQIRAIKEQLRRIPNKGIGYGIHRYLRAPVRPGGEKMAEIRFNYLGQFDHEFDNSLFYYSGGDAGSDAGPANRMTAKLDWNAMIIQGQFCLMIDYNTRAHKASTIHWLLSEFLDNLRRILEHIKREKNIYFTPSDFDAVELDEEDLNALFR